MDLNLYTQEYYYYLIVFLCLLILISLKSYFQYHYNGKSVNVIVILFSAFITYYIGSRDINIGGDTPNYKYAFQVYEQAREFEIRKDPLYDYLAYTFAKVFNFQAFLTFCAFLYVFGALYGFKKIFKENYFLPFLVFLISPYFIGWGVNVMRSGIAASLFLIGLGFYYKKGKIWKVILCVLGSVLFHLSMLVPLLFFFITRYIKNTKIIFFVWISSILLSFFDINIIAQLVSIFDIFTARIGNYTVNEGDRSYWNNFLIFGVFPVIFAMCNILILKYKNDFYKWMINAYMLTHIPYIVLLDSQFGLRLGYLAEFMMPIILLFPLLINPELKIKYDRFKLSIFIFIIFMIKAYKVLTI